MLKKKNIIDIFTIIIFMLAIYTVFIYAPIEKEMGISQKIFYFHVASAWIAFFAFFITFMGSLIYLLKRNRKADYIAYSSAEIGVLFTSMVLISGPIWAKTAWNTYWTWDPRLTTTLVLWFIYISYLLLRTSITGEKKYVYSAVFGIFGFIDVPIVFMSIRWWRTIHPVVVSSGGFDLSSEMVIALLVSILAFTFLYISLVSTRYEIEKISEKIKSYQSRIGG